MTHRIPRSAARALQKSLAKPATGRAAGDASGGLVLPYRVHRGIGRAGGVTRGHDAHHRWQIHRAGSGARPPGCRSCCKKIRCSKRLGISLRAGTRSQKIGFRPGAAYRSAVSAIEESGRPALSRGRHAGAMSVPSRMRKDPQELAVMRRAAALADQVMAEALQVTEAGCTGI